MRVTVRFMSYLSSSIGAEKIEVNLPDQASLSDLVQHLQAIYPDHAALLARITYLVDKKSTSPDTSLADNGEVIALMSLGGG